jgi:hypothetical protein
MYRPVARFHQESESDISVAKSPRRKIAASASRIESGFRNLAG